MSDKELDIQISLDLKTPDIAIGIEKTECDIQLDLSSSGLTYPVFDGPYHAESRLDEEIVLPTKSKIMADDFVVDTVYVYRVTNSSGGYTYFIGR